MAGALHAIRTDVVGSLLRPFAWQQARTRFDARELSTAALQDVEQACVRQLVALQDPVRSDQADLHRLLGHSAGALVFLKRDVVGQRKPSHRRPPVRHCGAGLREIRNVPTPQRSTTRRALLLRLQRLRRGVITTDRQSETVLKIQPADFAVSHHIEADRFL